ncbi:hypothetical protein [Gallaecimonas pentaromativorans]|uniref:Uncharacterized protein n=1 Tax=Gallaecimonas pentaromativorans TaxID=584787 RepID=A0A3N1PHN7_9GAMM|nr:hypothetical protein [Gallaecimonas pentaromativorans]ROQ27579.1 hypothetical protein EDC28_104230 [Gallaecimonas pentaromativorans]
MATLMLRDVDDLLVEQLKKLYGEATASKAFLAAGARAPILHEECNRLMGELKEARELIVDLVRSSQALALSEARHAESLQALKKFVHWGDGGNAPM